MANITQRGNTFRIRVFVGTDNNGKKIMNPPPSRLPKMSLQRKPKNLHRNTLLSLSVSAEGTLSLMTVCVSRSLQIGILPILHPLS